MSELSNMARAWYKFLIGIPKSRPALYPTLYMMSSPTSVDSSPCARCSGGHRFDSCRVGDSDFSLSHARVRLISSLITFRVLIRRKYVRRCVVLACSRLSVSVND